MNENNVVNIFISQFINLTDAVAYTAGKNLDHSKMFLKILNVLFIAIRHKNRGVGLIRCAKRFYRILFYRIYRNDFDIFKILSISWLKFPRLNHALLYKAK